MTTLAIMATSLGIIMSIGVIPQIYKIFHRKSAKDISGITYFILTIGMIIWVLYGFEINSWPNIITSGLGGIVYFIILVGWFLYK